MLPSPIRPIVAVLCTVALLVAPSVASAKGSSKRCTAVAAKAHAKKAKTCKVKKAKKVKAPVVAETVAALEDTGTDSGTPLDPSTDVTPAPALNPAKACRAARSEGTHRGRGNGFGTCVSDRAHQRDDEDSEPAEDAGDDD